MRAGLFDFFSGTLSLFFYFYSDFVACVGDGRGGRKKERGHKEVKIAQPKYVFFNFREPYKSELTLKKEYPPIRLIN